MPFRSRSNHCIFKERIRLPVHQSRPSPKGCRIHEHDVIGSSEQLQPRFNFVGFAWVLLSRQLDTSLYRVKGDS